MKPLNKVFLVCLIFILIVFSTNKILFGGINYEKSNGDFKGHFERISGLTENDYFPFISWVLKPFTISDEAFYFAGLLISFLIIPFLLFKLSEHFISVVFYFASAVPWTLSYGYYPMGFSIIFMLLVLLCKDNRLNFLLVLISFFVHSLAFPLVVLAWLGSLYGQKVFFGCSAFLQEKIPMLERPVELYEGDRVAFRLNEFLVFLWKIFPLPFLLLSLKYTWESKENYHLLFIGVVAFLLSLVEYRANLITALVLIPSASAGFVGFFSVKWRNLFVLLLLFFIGVQFWSWLNVVLTPYDRCFW